MTAVDTANVATTSPWIRRFAPAPEAATRLICLPHAGGSAPFYLPVARALAPDVDVLAVQYPGRQDRRFESCVADLAQLADLVAAELRPWTDRPYALFGHSLGATLGFEVARRLTADGSPPRTLYASARRAPSCQRDERVHLGSDERVIAEMRSLSGTDASLLADEEMLRMVMPALRADYRAIETYRYRPGTELDCPIVAITGDDDPQVTLDEARAWETHTRGDFELQVYAGGHFYLTSYVDRIVADIATRMTSFG